MKIRQPVVAGSFYPSDAMMLRRDVSEYISSARMNVLPKPSYAVICPHAGYVYSGHVAAYSYVSAIDEIKNAETIVIIGPNHTGIGSDVALSSVRWSTPLGILSIDHEFISMITDELMMVDDTSHASEHSIEVQLPFLQYVNPSAMIVPICMKAQDISTADHVAQNIFEAEKKSKRKVFVIASSDLSHYVPSDIGEKVDMYVLESVFELDVKGFYDRLFESGASFCGYGPIAVAMFYSSLKGCESAELLKFASSGEINANYSQVVDYAAISFVKKV